MLISLALLVRTTTKMKARKLEKYEQRIEGLELELRSLKSESAKIPSEF